MKQMAEKIIIQNMGRLWMTLTGPGVKGTGTTFRAYELPEGRELEAADAADSLVCQYQGKAWHEVSLPEYLVE